MSSILKVDQIQLANGSTPTAGDLGLNVSGSVVQVIRGSNSSFTSLSTTGTWVDASCSATITPTSSSNKILVVASEAIYGDTDGDNQSEYGEYRLLRDSSAIWTSNSSMLSRGGQTPFINSTFSYLDTPATTSAVTYKTQFNRSASGNRSVRMNAWGNANIILMEIAG